MLASELIQMRNGPDFIQLAAKANFSSFCEFLTRASAKKIILPFIIQLVKTLIISLQLLNNSLEKENGV